MLKKIVKFAWNSIRVAKSGLFSSEFYLESNSELKGRVKSPLLHFMRRGWREGRSPSSMFDLQFYINKYQPVGNPVVHFLDNRGNFSLSMPKLYLTPKNKFRNIKHDLIENPNENDIVFFCKNKINIDLKSELLKVDVESEFKKDQKLVAILPNGSVYQGDEIPFKGWAGESKELLLREEIYWIRGDLLIELKKLEPKFKAQGFSKNYIWEHILTIINYSGYLFKEIDSGTKSLKKRYKDEGRPYLSLENRLVNSNSRFKPKVAAVILNYNCADEVHSALTNIESQVDHVFIVDNNSSDFVKLRSSDRVSLIQSGKNLGYAGGNNLGLKRAVKEGFSHIVVMNPDARITGIDKMLRHFSSSSDIGVVSPLIKRDTGQIWYAGFESDPVTGVPTQITDSSLGKRDIEMFTGCVFMISARCIESAGYLPEDYFLYFEDCDYGKTLTKKGWRILFDPEIEAVHHQTSTGKNAPAKPHYLYYFLRNRIKFIYKWETQKLPVLFKEKDPFIEGHKTKIISFAPERANEYQAIIDRGINDGLDKVSGDTF